MVHAVPSAVRRSVRVAIETPGRHRPERARAHDRRTRLAYDEPSRGVLPACVQPPTLFRETLPPRHKSTSVRDRSRTPVPPHSLAVHNPDTAARSLNNWSPDRRNAGRERSRGDRSPSEAYHVMRAAVNSLAAQFGLGGRSRRRVVLRIVRSRPNGIGDPKTHQHSLADLEHLFIVETADPASGAGSANCCQLIDRGP